MQNRSEGETPEKMERCLQQYLGDDRHYHNLGHVSDCLRRLPELLGAATHDPVYREELIVATLYHDCVYEPLRSDNEEKSANAAVAANPQLNADILRRIILATKHTWGALSLMEERILVDVDLAGLGEDYGMFDTATLAIRKEYKMVDDQAFWNGRIAFLEKMAGRKRIYYTDLYFERYEVNARRNLKRSIEECASRLVAGATSK